VEWAPDDWAVDHANTLFADGYAILGVRAGYRRPDGISFFVEGRNLTDRKYAATTGLVADAGGLDSRQFLPGDGVSFFAGVEWRQ
jgi:iron complex outermembrane recepter protein